MESPLHSLLTNGIIPFVIVSALLAVVSIAIYLKIKKKDDR
jgi:hypothetical protein